MNAAWIRHSQRTLETPPEVPGKMHKHVVRIYYRSEAGELLCVDSAPLTWQAADALEWSLKNSTAVAVTRWKPGHEIRAGARLVVFPSQAPDQPVP